MNKYLVSYCSHVKNRLEHVKLTLEYNLVILSKYDNVELVLSDFDSNDGLFEWIKTNKNLKKYLSSGLLKYYKVFDEPHFKMATSKNLSHRLASGDYLINLDVDNYLSDEYVLNVVDSIDDNLHTVITKKDTVTALFGRIGLSKKIFYDLNGYDEIYTHWGCEDNDLLCRIIRYQKISKYLINYIYIDPTIMGSYIEHDNDLRINNYNINDLNSKNLNHDYDMFIHDIDGDGVVTYNTNKKPIFKTNNQDYLFQTMKSDSIKTRCKFSSFDVYMLKNGNLTQYIKF